VEKNNGIGVFLIGIIDKLAIVRAGTGWIGFPRITYTSFEVLGSIVVEKMAHLV